MTNEELIEKLAETMFQGSAYNARKLARAILPIIKAERVRGGEMVKAAAARETLMICLTNCEEWTDEAMEALNFAADRIRALSVPAIVEASDDCLKPCPFCGCAMHISQEPGRGGYLGPDGNHAKECIMNFDLHDYAQCHRDMLVRDWNTRAVIEADRAELVAEIVAELRDEVHMAHIRRPDPDAALQAYAAALSNAADYIEAKFGGRDA